jgi:putative membrane protein
LAHPRPWAGTSERLALIRSTDLESAADFYKAPAARTGRGPPPLLALCHRGLDLAFASFTKEGTIMRHTLFVFALLTLGLAGRAWAVPADKEFVEKAAIGGMMEVELGRYASTHAASPAVRTFGQRMATDHSKANAELTAIARQEGLSVPTVMDEKHRKEVAKLTEKTGSDFDEAYMKMMVDDHKDVIDEFRAQADEGKSEVDRFAAKTLPTIESHLSQAKTLKETLKKQARR